MFDTIRNDFQTFTETTACDDNPATGNAQEVPVSADVPCSVYPDFVRAQAALITDHFGAELSGIAGPHGPFAGLREALRARMTCEDHDGGGLALSHAEFDRLTCTIVRNFLGMPDIRARESRLRELTTALAGEVLTNSPGPRGVLPPAMIGRLSTGSRLKLARQGFAALPAGDDACGSFAIGDDGPIPVSRGPVLAPPNLRIAMQSLRVVAECRPDNIDDAPAILGRAMLNGRALAVPGYNLDASRTFDETGLNRSDSPNLEFVDTPLPAGKSNYMLTLAQYEPKRTTRAVVEFAVDFIIRVLSAGVGAVKGNVLEAIKGFLNGPEEFNKVVAALLQFVGMEEMQIDVVQLFTIEITRALDALFASGGNRFRTVTVLGTADVDAGTLQTEIAGTVTGGSDDQGRLGRVRRFRRTSRGSVNVNAFFIDEIDGTARAGLGRYAADYVIGFNRLA